MAISTHTLKHPLGFRFLNFDDPIGFNYLLPHRHNCWEIIIFSTGRGTHTIDFQKWNYGESTVHFVQPHQAHLLEDASSQAEGAVLMFDESYFPNNTESKKFRIALNNLQFSDSGPILTLERDHFDHLLKILDLIKSETENGGIHKREILQNYLNAVFYQCHRYMSLSEKSKSGNIHDLELMLKFKKRVDQNFKKIRTIRTYAKMLHCTSRKIRKVCHIYSGMTPRAYIHHKIIHEARRILIYEDRSPNRIADELHFSDSAHFTRFFRQKTGMSPGAFRSEFKSYIYKSRTPDFT